MNMFVFLGLLFAGHQPYCTQEGNQSVKFHLLPSVCVCAISIMLTYFYCSYLMGLEVLSSLHSPCLIQQDYKEACIRCTTSGVDLCSINHAEASKNPGCSPFHLEVGKCALENMNGFSNLQYTRRWKQILAFCAVDVL